MIKNFNNRETAKIFRREQIRKFSVALQKIALRKLWMLNAATELRDLLIPPGNRLEILKGTRHGQHSIRINDQWRICFVWHENNAYQVEIIDYH